MSFSLSLGWDERKRGIEKFIHDIVEGEDALMWVWVITWKMKKKVITSVFHRGKRSLSQGLVYKSRLTLGLGVVKKWQFTSALMEFDLFFTHFFGFSRRLIIFYNAKKCCVRRSFWISVVKINLGTDIVSQNIGIANTLGVFFYTGEPKFKKRV